MLTALLAGCASQAPPSALVDPERAERIIREMAGADHCAPQDGGSVVECRVRFSDGVVRRVRMSRQPYWSITVRFDRRERRASGFRPAMSGFFQALDVSHVDLATRIASGDIDRGIESFPLNVSMRSSCIHDPDLPQNREDSALLLMRPGGSLCSISMSHRS